MKRTTNPEELLRRKAQKRLEALNFTPQAARQLSVTLRMMATPEWCMSSRREAILCAFTELSSPLYRKDMR